MRHPARTLRRETRTRRPKRPGRDLADLDALTWPEGSLRVKDLMTRPALSIRQSATAGAAWKLMKTRRIRHLPVLDDAGRLVGLLSDRDLRQVILDPALQQQLGQTPRAMNILSVKEVMTWGVVTVRPDTGVLQAARIMRDQRIGALPVVDGRKVVGMLTGFDLVGSLVRIMEQGVVSRPERWGREA